jgi:hypothetical protein
LIPKRGRKVTANGCCYDLQLAGEEEGERRGTDCFALLSSVGLGYSSGGCPLVPRPFPSTVSCCNQCSAVGVSQSSVSIQSGMENESRIIRSNLVLVATRTILQDAFLARLTARTKREMKQQFISGNAYCFVPRKRIC